MSRAASCTAPKTGRHRDAATTARCPVCGPRAAFAADVRAIVESASKPPSFKAAPVAVVPSPVPELCGPFVAKSDAVTNDKFGPTGFEAWRMFVAESFPGLEVRLRQIFYVQYDDGEYGVVRRADLVVVDSDGEALEDVEGDHSDTIEYFADAEDAADRCMELAMVDTWEARFRSPANGVGEEIEGAVGLPVTDLIQRALTPAKNLAALGVEWRNKAARTRLADLSATGNFDDVTQEQADFVLAVHRN